MKCREVHAYVLTPSDVVRLRELLAAFSTALDGIFDRSEVMMGPGAEEIMGDLAFFEKCGHPEGVSHEF